MSVGHFAFEVEVGTGEEADATGDEAEARRAFT